MYIYYRRKNFVNNIYIYICVKREENLENVAAQGAGDLSELEEVLEKNINGA